MTFDGVARKNFHAALRSSKSEHERTTPRLWFKLAQRACKAERSRSGRGKGSQLQNTKREKRRFSHYLNDQLQNPRREREGCERREKEGERTQRRRRQGWLSNSQKLPSHLCYCFNGEEFFSSCLASSQHSSKQAAQREGTNAQQREYEQDSTAEEEEGSGRERGRARESGSCEAESREVCDHPPPPAAPPRAPLYFSCA